MNRSANRPRSLLGRFDRRSPIERFNESYEIISNGCWIWKYALTYNGYSRFRADGEVSGHRWSYKFFKGPIEPGVHKHINHLCRNRACVNPDHLEYVSAKENIRNGETGARFRNQTRCKHGHSYVETGFYLVRGSRQCKPCVKMRHKNKRLRER